MTNHVKPTKKELEETAKKAAEEAEKLENASPSPTQAEPTPTVSVSPSPTPADISPSVSVSPSPSPEPPSPSPSPEPYKKKFIASSKEALVLHGKQKKMNEAIDEAANLPDPTEEEMRKEYPQWDDMDDASRKTATITVKNSRSLEIIKAARAESKNFEAWAEKVETFIKDPKTLVANPDLEGKTDEFGIFATQPTRVGVDFDILVSAFLHDATRNMKPKKKEMFPTGENRSNVKPKPKTDKISVEEGARLRKTNYPKYRELLKAGKIETEPTT